MDSLATVPQTFAPFFLPVDAPSIPAMPIPPRIHVCVEDDGVREMISLLLTDAGYYVTDQDVVTWLVENASTLVPPKVMILDAWPLRQPNTAAMARAQLGKQSAAVVLLVDTPQPPAITDQFGAIATLPLCFTLDDLVFAVEQGCQMAL
jgi:hypothetical protein